MQFEKQTIKTDVDYFASVFDIERKRGEHLLDLTNPFLKKYSSTRNWKSKLTWYSPQQMTADFASLAENRNEESFLIFSAGMKIEEWRQIGSEKGCQCPECREEAEQDGKEEDDEFLDLLKSIFGRAEAVKREDPKVSREDVIEKLKNAINEEFGHRGVIASVIDFDPFSSNKKGRSLRLQAKDESIRPEVDRFAKKILDENGWKGVMI